MCCASSGHSTDSGALLAPLATCADDIVEQLAALPLQQYAEMVVQWLQQCQVQELLLQAVAGLNSCGNDYHCLRSWIKLQ